MQFKLQKRILNPFYKSFLPYFLLFFPIIDATTSLVTSYTDLLISPGVIVRCFLLFAALFYIFFLNKNKRKLNILVVAILFILTICSTLANYNTLQSNTYEYLNYAIKFDYFIIMLTYFRAWFTNGNSFNISSLRITLFVIILCFLLPLITHTGFTTYNYLEGFSGWFNSSNEISALLCCLYPISIYNIIKEKTNIRTIIDVIISISVVIIMFALGTKAAAIGFFITTIAFLLYLIINAKNFKRPEIIILLSIFILVPILFQNYLPITHNLKENIRKINQQISLQQENTSSEEEQNPEENSIIEKVLLNGRDEKEKTAQKFKKESSIYNHLFGYSSIKKEKIHIIERDFHDIKNLFGVISFVFLILLLIPDLLFITINTLANISKPEENLRSFSIFLASWLFIGLAFICGHSILSPAVATFFLLIFQSYSNSQKHAKQKIIFTASTGGHLTQLLTLQPIFSDYDSTIVTEKTPIKRKYPCQHYFLIHTSRKKFLKYIFQGTINIIHSFLIFSKINPDTIVSTGSHTTIPLCIFGWIYNKKVIHIESYAKTQTPTKSGKLIYHFATIFVVQWKSMKKIYPKAVYWGGIY